jgi:hypothetical protein
MDDFSIDRRTNQNSIARTEIDAVLKSVAEICEPKRSGYRIDRHAYPTNAGLDFTFSRDTATQPQAPTARVPSI